MYEFEEELMCDICEGAAEAQRERDATHKAVGVEVVPVMPGYLTVFHSDMLMAHSILHGDTLN